MTKTDQLDGWPHGHEWHLTMDEKADQDRREFNLSLIEFYTLLLLRSMGKNGAGKPQPVTYSNDYLAVIIGVSKRALINALNKLETLGLISRDYREMTNQTTRFIVCNEGKNRPAPPRAPHAPHPVHPVHPPINGVNHVHPPVQDVHPCTPCTPPKKDAEAFPARARIYSRTRSNSNAKALPPAVAKRGEQISSCPSIDVPESVHGTETTNKDLFGEDLPAPKTSQPPYYEMLRQMKEITGWAFRGGTYAGKTYGKMRRWWNLMGKDFMRCQAFWKKAEESDFLMRRGEWQRGKSQQNKNVGWLWLMDPEKADNLINGVYANENTKKWKAWSDKEEGKVKVKIRELKRGKVVKRYGEVSVPKEWTMENTDSPIRKSRPIGSETKSEWWELHHHRTNEGLQNDWPVEWSM